MPAYAALPDLIDRYGEEELVQLTDRLGIGAIDPQVALQALADAAAEIDGHLAGRYALPLATVPPLLTAYACDLAREKLYKDVAPEIVVKRADDARRFLRLAAEGRIGLGVSPAPDTPGGVQVAAGERVFDIQRID